MEWHFTTYAGILIFAGLLLTIDANLVWHRKNTIPGGTTFTLLMVVAAGLSFFSALEIAAVGIPAKVFWAKMEYLGNQSGPVLLLIFAMKYTHLDKWLTRRNILLLWVIPAVTILMAATNEWHNLIWTSFTPSPDDPAFLIYGHGFWFWICAAYGYVVVLTGLITLYWAAAHTPQLYRHQIGILLAAAIVPGFGSVIYLVGLSPIAGLDTAPLTFALTGLILTGGIFGFGLFNLVPVARNTLVENMNDSVLVLDRQNRIVDINLAARKLLTPPGRSAIGQPVDSVLAAWPELLAKYKDMQETQTEICLSKEPPQYLDLHISPVYDRRKRLTGKLIVLHDITERRRMQATLVHNVEELGIINRINQAITSGLDLDLVLKTLHEQCALVAPFDIFYVGLYDEMTALIQIPLYYEAGQYHTGPARDIRQRPGNIGDVIQKRQTLYLPDIKKTAIDMAPTIPATRTAPIRSYVGIPLILRDRVIGAMSFQSYKPKAYTEEQIGLLENIAMQAAIAISNAQLYAEVQRLAIIDELTSLYNYRGLMALGAREVERARRFNRPLCAIFLDIDDFKAFNNRYGHATGNQVLQVVAHCCLSNMRAVDLIARYGGDEFVVLLPETDLQAGHEVTSRLSQFVAQNAAPTKYGDLSVTISLGLAVLTPDMKDLIALIERANQAELLAKKMGTGRIVALEDG
jgi:diguanylate cyclase (GGDEF)-like protein